MLNYNPEQQKKQRRYVKPKQIVPTVKVDDIVDREQLISEQEANEYTQDFKGSRQQRRAEVPLPSTSGQTEEEEKVPEAAADPEMSISDGEEIA